MSWYVCATKGVIVQVCAAPDGVAASGRGSHFAPCFCVLFAVLHSAQVSRHCAWFQGYRFLALGCPLGGDPLKSTLRGSGGGLLADG